ncbi:uncharacterized protein CcaverHIS019_0402120 [Cutaneotrichosporon cavernicola]|uniref:Uncharacterized protein n=1 Tax=Cutaneotrichosporon cavernicola TaxID=279322 RepID=A0AA48L3Q4_9TREE|nr:uncharacterized protein CcaverHIS019_0402120 [Cutaneotrichosporon cavernicola]BEI91392.1 hypothetical protein CcaverHIS019_0402120 [Cutaneotrichosporon cavernicola]BEI99166.1 hypothetical protein CcaverHIS631_0402090 [Cutaneotrichosporon cavernicola]BEJ06942.1 hypothetical protein CcaverHIS641_0402110 [Cutaneotrichosporon cavernicola]
MTAGSNSHSQSVLDDPDDPTGIGVNHAHHKPDTIDAAPSSLPSDRVRNGSISSRFTGVDPLDSSHPAPGHIDIPGSFPDTSIEMFDGPSSAPPTPSVISVTHPSQFIHTHHPRRGSITPLGLNVISPVAPQLQHVDGAVHFAEGGSHLGSSPMRTVGFHAADGSAYMLGGQRRDSVATTSSSASKTSGASYLTATRPGYSSGVYRRSSLTPSLQSLPAGTSSPQLLPTHRSTPLVDSSRRRGSLTPSVPTLSAPSPTRALAAGKLVAKLSAGDLPIHAHTADVVAERRGSAAALQAESRRGSLPQLYYGAWTSTGDRRGSGESDLGQATIRRGFKFGSINSAEQEQDGAAGSLQRIAQLSWAKKSEASAFEEAEQAEAERQRRAFLAATYGEEGRRARARLSLGGNSATTSPASTRRQSLVLWERIKSSTSSSSTGHGTPGGPSTTTSDDLIQIRRPSLPVNIPRTPRADQAALFDDQTVWDNPDDLPDVEDVGATPQRPLPPLLPLSDPVPRLLPSTLALHRASHLLHARNLASEPLPAPLPPSLHPPQPVDLSEFDIDFILAGSRSQLGREGSKGSQRRSNQSRRGSVESLGQGARPPLEEEDSFALFVGAHDDEYGGRRGEWTFRALPRPVQPVGKNPTRPVPRAEWESSGAGRYEIYPNGDVRSVESGSVWRVKRASTREYELEQPMPGLLSAVNVGEPPGSTPPPLVLTPCSAYALTSKTAHTENGGVKLPIPVQRELSRNSRFSRRFVAASRNRPSVGDLLESDERRRTSSQDSGATATAQAQPLHPIQPPRVPAMRHRNSNTSSASNNSPTSLSPPKDERGPKEKRTIKGRKDTDDEKKKDKGFSGVFKRGLFKATNMLEEGKESGRKFWPNGTSGSLKTTAPIHRMLPHHNSDRSDSASASSQHSSKYASESADDEHPDEMFGSLGLGIEDEQNGGHPWKEGKGWEFVPEEALAMVVPVMSDWAATPPLHSPAETKAFINPFFVGGPRKALLVWFTPFNPSGSSTFIDSPKRQGSSTLFKITEAPHHEGWEGGSSMSSSLARLPKLLRPRGNRADHHSGGLKRVPVRPTTATPPTDDEVDRSRSSSRASRNLQPLPFRGFRVVAMIVNTEELRAESAVPVIPLEAWNEQLRTGKPAAGIHTPPMDGRLNEIPSRSPSVVDNPSLVNPNRAFPTVIAVCHSQTTGVEFVLEGLDRLGLCKGESAWGPTGYEEWRGTGLSDSGRQMLDLIWAGCVAVMGV